MTRLAPLAAACVLAALSTACGGPTARADACRDFSSGAMLLTFGSPPSAECPALGTRTARNPQLDSSGGLVFGGLDGCPAGSVCTVGADAQDHGDLYQDYLCALSYTETRSGGQVECMTELNGGSLTICNFWPDGGDPAYTACQYSFTVTQQQN